MIVFFFVLALQQRRSPRVLLRKMPFTTSSIGRVYVGVDRFLAYKVGPELADREINGGTWVVPLVVLVESIMQLYITYNIVGMDPPASYIISQWLKKLSNMCEPIYEVLAVSLQKLTGFVVIFTINTPEKSNI